MAKAQKGDLIRITNADANYGYENGDIVEVVYRWVNDLGVKIKSTRLDEWDKSRPDVADYEYEIHRKAGEEDAATVPAKATLHSREMVLPKHEAEVMQDAVHHPNHYMQGRFETIEIIEEITQGYSDGYVAYCVGNALKYLARAPFKHGEPTEDIGKAAKYIEFALERLQTQK